MDTKKIIFMRSDYNEHSELQKQMFAASVKYIDLAIEKHELQEGNNFLMIADYGSSAGANSSADVEMVLTRILQKYGVQRSVMVVHNDLPENNWSGLFNYLNSNKGSYLSDTKANANVFALCSGKSFYNQILPERSVHFGISCAAVHWLSKLPCKLKNHLMGNLGRPEEIQIFRKQAAEDWERFLLARSRELSVGSVLVISLPCGSGWGYLTILDTSYAALRRLLELEIISQKEFIDINVPVYYRDIDDITNTEQLQRHGFELIICENCTDETCYFYKTMVTCEDKNAWASDVAYGVMAVVEPLVLQSLSSQRSAEERRDICSKFLSIFGEEISKLQPSQLSDRTGDVFIVLKKVK